MKAERHLFGSFDGYQTLAASPGVHADEAAELSEFGFGQTSDQDTLDDLARRFCVLGRRLRSGRIALTRAFAGRPDDAGRPTVELRTMVLEAADFDHVRSDLKSFFALPDHWDDNAFREGKPATISTTGIKVSPSRDAWYLVDSWIKLKGRRDIVIRLPDDDRSDDAIFAAVGSINPDDALDLRWGLHLFSTSAAVDVCTLAPSASLSTRRQVMSLSLSQNRWRHPHLEQLASKNAPMSPFRVLENPEIESYDLNAGLISASTGSVHRRASASESRGKNPLFIAGSVGVVLVVVIIVLVMLPSRSESPADTDATVASEMSRDQFTSPTDTGKSGSDEGSAFEREATNSEEGSGEDTGLESGNGSQGGLDNEDQHSEGGQEETKDPDPTEAERTSANSSKGSRFASEVETNPDPESESKPDQEPDTKPSHTQANALDLEKLKAIRKKIEKANTEFKAFVTVAKRNPPSEPPKQNVGNPNYESYWDERRQWKKTVKSALSESLKTIKELTSAYAELEKIGFLQKEKNQKWVSGWPCPLMSEGDYSWFDTVVALCKSGEVTKENFKSRLATMVSSKKCLGEVIDGLDDRFKFLEALNKSWSMTQLQAKELQGILKKRDKDNEIWDYDSNRKTMDKFIDRQNPTALIDRYLISEMKNVPGWNDKKTSLADWLKFWARTWNNVQEVLK